MMRFAAIVGTMSAALTIGGPALAADAEKGKKLFNRCSSCHSLKAKRNLTGPSLHGVVGRKAATAPRYRYSKGLKEAGAKGLVWQRATLLEYLKDPTAFLKKFLDKKTVSNKMKNRFPSEAMRSNIVAYLESLKE